MSLIQLLKFRTWEMRLFKMPRFETPRFQMGTKVTVASQHGLAGNKNVFFCYMKLLFPNIRMTVT